MIPSCVQIIGGRPQIEPGALIHTVTLQHNDSPPPSGAVYDAAGVRGVWTPYATALAAFEQPSAREARDGSVVQTQAQIQFALWYQPGVLSSDRVVMEDGAVYAVVSVENVGKRNLVLVLTCEGLSV